MATYYFLGTSGAEPTDWNDTSNWYDAPSDGGNGYLPTSSDDVVISALVNTSSSTPTVNSMTIDTGGIVSISVNVTNTCSVLSGGRLAQGTLTGNVLCDNGTVGYASGATGGPSIIGNLTFINGGSTDADISYPISVDGNVYFNNGWYSSASDINVSQNVYYQYGYAGTTSNISAGGSTSYTDYPTLYFYNNMSTDWGTVTNWWVDYSHTQQADSIPTSTQDVILDSDVTSDSSGTATANNIIVNYYGINTGRLLISATVTANTIFNTSTYYGDGTNSITLTSPAVEFNGDSYLAANASIVGNVNFYDTSANNGSITGDATVYSNHAVPFDSSHGNTGTISGSIIYSGYSPRTVYYYHTSSSDDWGYISNWYYGSGGTGGNVDYIPNGDVALDTVIVEASIGSNVYGYNTVVGSLSAGGSVWIGISISCGEANFTDSFIFGYGDPNAVLSHLTATNNITFNDLSSNEGIINAPYPAYPVEFTDSSTNDGTINGDVDVYYPSEKPVGGTVNGTVIYYGYTLYFGGMANDGDWNNPNNWYLDANNSSPYNDIPSDVIPYQDVVLQYSVIASNQPPYPGVIEGVPSAYDLLCSGGSVFIEEISIIIYNLATFENGGYIGTNGTITGDAIFKDYSTNQFGNITGTATFTLSAAETMITNGYDGTYGNIEFQYGKGVNGSSILGLV